MSMSDDAYIVIYILMLFLDKHINKYISCEIDSSFYILQFV